MFHFRLSYGLLTGLLALTLLGPIGCSGTGTGTPCTSDATCTAGQKCNVTTGKCEGGTTAGCTTTADCGDKKVCDGSKCYDDCTADGFVGCDPGNTCAETGSKRCECDVTKCAGVSNSGCHPVSNTCDNYCDPAGTDCSGEEKCVPLATDATKGFCQTPKSCTSDTDCAADAKYPKCDTAKGFCIPQAKCTDDTSCAGNAAGTKCNTTSGACVKCLADADCDTTKRETCDATTNACVAATGCAKSKECYDATPKTYCGEVGQACSAAPSRTCDNMVDSEKSLNADWDTNASGAVVWGMKEVERKTTNNCVSGGSGDACTDNSDCSGGEVCAGFDNKCHALLTNGEVVITFNFYSPTGIKSGYTDGANYKSGTSEKADFGWTNLATKFEIKSGDDKEGTAQISVCESKGPYKGWFYFHDTADKPSNAACIDISARN